MARVRSGAVRPRAGPLASDVIARVYIEWFAGDPGRGTDAEEAWGEG